MPIRTARPTNVRSNGARSDLPDLRDPLGLRGSLDPQDPLVQQVLRAHKARKDPSARKAQLANAVQPAHQEPWDRKAGRATLADKVRPDLLASAALPDRKDQLAQPVLQALRARRAIPVLQAPRAIEFTVRFVR